MAEWHVLKLIVCLGFGPEWHSTFGPLRKSQRADPAEGPSPSLALFGTGQGSKIVYRHCAGNAEFQIFITLDCSLTFRVAEVAVQSEWQDFFT